MKKLLVKIGFVSLIVLMGLTFNACEEVEEGDIDSENKEVVEEYYEGEDEDEEEQDTKGVISISGSIDDREFVLIYYHFSRESCQSKELKESILEEYEVTDIITEISTNNISCATYGKDSSSGECITSDTDYDIGTSCVVGMNSLSIEQSEKMTNKTVFLKRIQETIISKFY